MQCLLALKRNTRAQHTHPGRSRASTTKGEAEREEQGAAARLPQLSHLQCATWVYGGCTVCGTVYTVVAPWQPATRPIFRDLKAGTRAITLIGKIYTV